jgi:hypothetical protein
MGPSVAAAPNPSIERTSPGKPAAASHVKRWALSSKAFVSLHRGPRKQFMQRLAEAARPAAVSAPWTVGLGVQTKVSGCKATPSPTPRASGG